MNPKMKRNVIILSVLGAGLLFVVLKPFLMESEFDRKYRENQQKAAKDQAAGVAPGAAPAAAAATPVNAANGAPGTKSQFQKASVNVDQLIASIKEVTFDYDTTRTQRNPMTPLVGESAKAAIATAQGGEQAPGSTPVALANSDPQGVLRSFKVTGILWDKRDPMAVISYPVNGQLTSDVVTRGYKFADLDIVVNDIESERVILNVGGSLVSLQLEER